MINPTMEVMEALVRMMAQQAVVLRIGFLWVVLQIMLPMMKDAVQANPSLVLCAIAKKLVIQLMVARAWRSVVTPAT
jgi:hypothetical protein